MLTLQSSLTTLYNYQFQVMPFMYTQLVSFACAFYLIVYAILKGLHFTPDATVDYGFVFPFLALTLTTVTSLGLLEVGSIHLEPVRRRGRGLCDLHLRRPHGEGLAQGDRRAGDRVERARVRLELMRRSSDQVYSLNCTLTGVGATRGSGCYFSRSVHAVSGQGRWDPARSRRSG